MTNRMPHAIATQREMAVEVRRGRGMGLCRCAGVIVHRRRLARYTRLIQGKPAYLYATNGATIGC